jgi:hypothetical protein
MMCLFAALLGQCRNPKNPLAQDRPYDGRWIGMTPHPATPRQNSAATSTSMSERVALPGFIVNVLGIILTLLVGLGAWWFPRQAGESPLGIPKMQDFVRQTAPPFRSIILNSQ